MIEDPLLI